MENTKQTGLEIAVIGMTGRFPGADNLEEYWNNLKNGVESISFFSDEELAQTGVGPDTLSKPNFVKAHGELENKDYFDSTFFGYTPKEAELMDPQIRIFHECAWKVLEEAGYDPTSYDGAIGIYGGGSDNFTWRALEVVKGLGNDLGFFAKNLLGNSFFLSTRVSHKLNLRGPSLTFFTACSTSLVAIHLACRGLLMGECDMALAGGISITDHAKTGYMFEEGMILSPDGHCRSFDARAMGSIYGEGVGIVLLKRLKQAIKQGDMIHAVIKSTAINNDGTNKASFTAPSISGIASTIKEALRLSHIHPGDVSYLEAHGTATTIGDTLEMKALKMAFGTDSKGDCRIGTVKTNIGHLDAAAGVAGFIKTVLALKHKTIPPSLHFETPNHDIDFKNSPFRVNTELTGWNNRTGGNGTDPLVAGVNGFGIGGTNAFVVVEEAPGIKPHPQDYTREWKIFLLSARTPSALDKTTENLKTYLEQKPEVNPADVAYTLQVGRKAFQYRRMLVGRDNREAINILSSPDSRKIKTFLCKVEPPRIIFMFPGLGSQYVNMGAELYQKEKVFRQELDHCFDILTPLMGYDIKEILYPNERKAQGAERKANKRHALCAVRNAIDETEIAQLVIFAFEYALAKLLIQWGIKPQAMIGYSFGEYVAACLAGVLSLEHALELIVYRGQLIEQIPPGLMLSVPLPKQEVIPILPAELAIGIDNGPSCVVSGPKQQIEAFEKKMKEKKCLCMRLPVSHAIHSTMMDPILETFKEKIRQVQLNKPQIPYISNVTGNWVTGEEITDPGYWAKHLGGTVQFADGIKELVKKPNAIFVEIGPGRDLSALVQRYIDNNSDQRILNLIRHPEKDISDVYFLLSKIGLLWLYGKPIDWSAFYSEEQRHRISLPTYPFESQHFHVEGNPFQLAANMLAQRSPYAAKTDLADWFYIPSWKRVPSIPTQKRENHDPVQTGWLIFIHENNWANHLVKQLGKKHRQIILVRAGTAFARTGNNQYTINPGNDNDYEVLFKKIREEKGSIPGKMIHLWGITTPGTDNLTLDAIDRVLDLGYYCLLNIAKAIGKLNIDEDIQVIVVTNNMQEVGGEEQLCPEKAALLGPLKGIAKEYGNIRLRSIDVILPGPGSDEKKELINDVIKECAAEEQEPIIALRNHHRWQQIYEPVHLDGSAKEAWRLKDEGVYLITGGLGGIGHVLAQQIVRSVKNPKLILTGRTKLPEPREWDQWLEDHDEEDNISAKITKVRGLEEMGAKVLVCSAENSNLEQMHQVISRAEEQFGPINGVVHSAGLPDGAMIQVRTREQSEILFSAKLKGTLILDMLLKHVKLDFFVFCSSIDSIVANAGHVGYCSANSFLNAFATYKSNKDKVFTVAINWPRWQSLGMAIIQEELHKELKGYDLTGGLSIESGMDAFARILGASHPQVAVNVVDLGVVYERDKTIGTEAFMEEFDTAEAPDDTAENLFARPDLTSEYVAPQNESEQSLAKIWQRLFAIGNIGVQDDFFELGGDSLKVIIAISKIHKELDVEIPVSEFFNTPNIRDLAKYVTSDTSEDKESTYLSIEPAEEKEYYVLSSAQKRFYIIQNMEPGSTAYNETKVVMIQGKFDEHKLEKTLKSLLHRHEIYRTSIRLIDGSPFQRIHRMDEIELAIAGYQCANEDKAIKVVEHFARPFDLSQAPILRIGLITLSNQKYILVMDTHHIVTDKTSDGIFVRELLALYRGEELPALIIQYRDYTEWQNSRIQQKNIMKQEEYWMKQFEGEIPVLNLPYDYPRPEVQSLEGNGLTFAVEKEELDIFKALARQLDITLYMVLLSIFSILLAKLSGQEDIVIGTPVSGRRHAEIQSSVGLFINTLALRNEPRSEKTYREFIKDIRESTLKAFDNQDYPIEDIIDHLEVHRDLSRSPLFDVMFVLQNMEERPDDMLEEKIPDFKLLPFRYETPLSRYDLTFEVLEGTDNLTCIFQYCTKLFKPGTIERFIIYFKTIASIIVKETYIPLWQIDTLTGVERRQVLYDFNDTETAYPTDKTLDQLFAEQVEKTPGNLALLFKDRQLTYEELNKKSNQLARYLRAKHVKAESIVALRVERSLEMVVGLWAVLKAGGAFLPIDEEYPHIRRQLILQDSVTRVLLTQKHIFRNRKKEIETHPIENIVLIDDPDNYSTGSANLEIIHDPINPAYVIYTSGTSGKPKGVIIGHQAIVNYTWWAAGVYVRNQLVDFPLYTSISFDLTMTSIFTPLLTGNAIVVYGEEENTLLLERIINENKVGIIKCTPSHLKLIRNVEVHAALSHIKCFIVGGEELERDLALDIDKKFSGNIEIHNEYGPTETTVGCMIYQFDPGDNYGKSVPIGKPIDNMGIYILDKRLHLVPIGIAGELCISGDGVARGYLNNPELTAEKFIDKALSSLLLAFRRTERAKNALRGCNQPGALQEIPGARSHELRPNPLTLRAKSQEPRAKLYKTGDLGLWLPDGNIEFLGRIDRQVKIRGFRIEPGEIENRLLKHEYIQEAVALVKQDKNEEECLWAYIVTNQEFSIEEIREYLSKNLPAYMIPVFFVQLEKIPLTSNGKIDRKALKEYKQEVIAEPVPPRCVVEEKLTGIWADLLNIEKEKIGINGNFFLLGGNSLKTTIMALKIQKEFNASIDLTFFFNKPFIEDLGWYIMRPENKALLGMNENVVPIKKNSNHADHLFFIHSADGGIEAYIELCNAISNFNCWGIREDFIKPKKVKKLTIEGTAEKYAEIIRQIDPSGPYYIVGWSLGGTFAYEIVRYLEKIGGKINFLGMIEGTQPLKKNLLNYFLRKTTKREDYELNFSFNDAFDKYCPKKKIRTNIHYFGTDVRQIKTWKGLSSKEVLYYDFPGDHFNLVRPPTVFKLGALINKIISK